jgi:hypothetical protein
MVWITNLHFLYVLREKRDTFPTRHLDNRRRVHQLKRGGGKFSNVICCGETPKFRLATPEDATISPYGPIGYRCYPCINRLRPRGMICEASSIGLVLRSFPFPNYLVADSARYLLNALFSVSVHTAHRHRCCNYINLYANISMIFSIIVSSSGSLLSMLDRTLV